jgi:glycosyltransferase involved in cell wall biosynthesis
MTAISVIIPTYNCAQYLRESLDSILGQTHAPQEVIVVDDGSTDDTAKVLAAYGGHISAVAAPHRGYAAARNLGLSHARGEWIGFHDADDVALPDRLAAPLQALRQHPACEGIFCNGSRMDDGRPLVPSELARRANARPLTVVDVFDGFPIYFQGALLKRTVFEQTGAFTTTLGIHPDMEYGYRLLARHQIRFFDRPVFRYRWHGANVTRDSLAGREEIARILAHLAEADQASVARIGRRKLRARLARHYYQIARRRLALGQADEARRALGRALALRPLHPRYRLLSLWHAA